MTRAYEVMVDEITQRGIKLASKEGANPIEVRQVESGVRAALAYVITEWGEPIRPAPPATGTRAMVFCALCKSYHPEDEPWEECRAKARATGTRARDLERDAIDAVMAAADAAYHRGNGPLHHVLAHWAAEKQRTRNLRESGRE